MSKNFIITNKPVSNLAVSSEFGNRISPTTGVQSVHRGIDFPVPTNTTVYAAHGGEVTEKIFKKVEGNLVTIRDDSGYSTTYIHLNDFDKSLVKGGQVKGGDPIAFSGNTGTASKVPHLHFIVNDDKGISVNPRKYLAEAFPSEFPTDVKTNDYGLDLEDDYRDNTLIGNARANKMYGTGGFDTYRVGFGDTITDIDGKIVIDGTILEGNADPVKDALGNITPNQWNLSNYLLVRNGNDLLIFKSSDRLNIATATHITVTSYPFDLNQEVFGITLGKVKTPDLSAPDLFTDREIISGALFPFSGDKSGRFFAPVIVTTQLAIGTQRDFGIRVYNAATRSVSYTQKLTNLQTTSNPDGSGVVQMFAPTDNQQLCAMVMWR